MSIDLIWDNEARTILRYDYHPGWTLEDFDRAEHRLHGLLAEVPHEIDVIALFLPSSDPPVGSLSRFKRIQDEMPAQVGVVVVINSSPFVALLLSVFLRVYRQYAHRLWLADSLEDARRRLAERQRV
jgi:hypothetical protein